MTDTLITTPEIVDRHLQQEIIALDFDTGHDPAKIEKRIQELGLAAVVYSSFSHMKDSTDVNCDKVAGWAETDKPSDQVIIDYLREEKGLLPSILNGATV